MSDPWQAAIQAASAPLAEAWERYGFRKQRSEEDVMEQFVVIRADGGSIGMAPVNAMQFRLTWYERSGEQGASSVWNADATVLQHIPGASVGDLREWLQGLGLHEPPAALWEAVQGYATGDFDRVRAALDVVKLRADYAKAADSLLRVLESRHQDESADGAPLTLTVPDDARTLQVCSPSVAGIGQSAGVDLPEGRDRYVTIAFE